MCGDRGDVRLSPGGASRLLEAARANGCTDVFLKVRCGRGVGAVPNWDGDGGGWRDGRDDATPAV